VFNNLRLCFTAGNLLSGTQQPFASLTSWKTFTHNTHALIVDGKPIDDSIERLSKPCFAMAFLFGDCETL